MVLVPEPSVDRLAVVHGARHSWDLGYQSELIALVRVSQVVSSHCSENRTTCEGLGLRQFVKRTPGTTG